MVCFFCHSRQKQSQIPTKGFTACQQTTGLLFDPRRGIDGILQQTGLSHHNTPYRLSRFGHGPKVLLSYEQLRAARTLTIAHLYKARWQVELFFKWIKQHLRIKTFYGTSENAVKTQIWIAVSSYVLIAIMKKRLGIEQSLYTILQILSVSLFEKSPILQVFSKDDDDKNRGDDRNQLELFQLLTGH
jgi:hypothetical protein